MTLTPVFRSPVPLFRNEAEVLGNLTSCEFSPFLVCESRGHGGHWCWEGSAISPFTVGNEGLDRAWYTLVLYFVPVLTPHPTKNHPICLPPSLYISASLRHKTWHQSSLLIGLIAHMLCYAFLQMCESTPRPIIIAGLQPWSDTC